MNRIKHLQCVSFFIVFMLTYLQAQEVVSTSGGNADGNAGNVSYTVGQLFYTTNTGATGTVAQGVQQPFLVISGFEGIEGISLECIVFPNPTIDLLILKFENTEAIDLRYQISDLNGKILQIKEIECNETIISLENLLPSTYFLKVIKENYELKTFKIIKYK